MSEDRLSWDATEQTLVEIGEGESNAAAGVIAAVVVGVLATIALLFSFALFIDCRNKKKALKQQQQQNNQTKRMFPAKRAVFPQFISNSSSNRDNLSFVNQMCTDSTSIPPAVLANRSEDTASGTDKHHTLSFPSSSSSLTPHTEDV